MRYIEESLDETYICGIDEVGRGPLFGDVVCAAVIMKKNNYIVGIDDSKKLTEKKRNIYFNEIYKRACAIGLGSASKEEIDEINILNATKLAMTRALNEAARIVQPDIVLVDAVKLDIPYKTLSIIHGDHLSYNIAAASIIAKVSRDRLCYGWDKMYPEYGILKHKGYGTKAHREAILKYGRTPLHRESFKVKL
ncbi:RNase HII [Ezakiella coagulans]|uniref:Ribonuclease HII n=1 Tax=Ezakiella coagulans TaxID=46507 RepID=A0A2U1E3U9_9FIRM|nr:ribonuclease HII [Ezakiella coagulans]PVY94623.1 RNase HII [Ezakiella coagulans]